MNERLKLGIISDNDEIFLWQYRILEELIRTGCSDIVLCIKNNNECLETRDSHYSIFYSMHEKLDKLIFKSKFDFDHLINILKNIKGKDIIDLADKKINGELIQGNLAIFKNYNLDIILDFGKSPINKNLFKVTKYGIITYNIVLANNSKPTPSCYWEVVKKMPEIEAVIELENENSNEETIIGRTGILPYPNSINVNRNNIYGLATLMIPRVIAGICKNGNIFLEELKRNNNKTYEIFAYANLSYPNSFQAFSNLVHLIAGYIFKKLRRKKTERWFLIVTRNNKNKILPVDLGSFTKIKAPKEKFWADPFIISRNNYHYIFIEEYLVKACKAHISVLKLDDKFKLLECYKVLERPYHISYPHIVQVDNSYYMIPETGSNNTIELYKCTQFPYKWEFVMNLMDHIPARDTTLFFYNDKWWLFTSVVVMNYPTTSFSELFLYYSDNLFSTDWKSHPKNPIVSDHKLSRSAGNVYVHENKIYRPSQDCSGHYGKALNISCITELTETEYNEVLVKKVEPTLSNRLKGTHTYNFNDEVIVMDAF